MNTARVHIKGTVIFLTIFSIAMGFLESVVVLYLRQMYYPEGFAFPLKIMAVEGLSLEYLREISTIIIIISVSLVSGRTFYERLSYFIFCFGIWDIFYYFWLKVLLNWPPSLLTWDILFLIPVVWVGPVLAPLICAVTMIIIAGCILYCIKKGYPIKINFFEWMLLFSGAFIIFITFVWEYIKLVIQGGFISSIFSLSTNPQFQKIVTGYIPESYNWHLFLVGEVLLLLFLTAFFKRMKSTPQY